MPMKKLFVLLIALVLSVCAYAQPQGTPGTDVTFRGGAAITELLSLPIFTDTPTAGRARRQGSMIRVVKVPGDTVVYAYSKSGWGILNSGNISRKDTTSWYGEAHCLGSTSYNEDFIVDGTVIPRTTTTYVYGQPITWFAITTGNHILEYIIDSMYGDASGKLVIPFPPAKDVALGIMQNDEQNAQKLLFMGATVALNNAAFYVVQSRTVSQRLVGNGTSAWTQENGTNYLSLGAMNTGTGVTSFNIVDALFASRSYNDLHITYSGNKNYRAVNVYSGLGIYNIGVKLMDDYNNPVLSYPDANDELTIGPLGNIGYIIPMDVYGLENSWLPDFGRNFWVHVRMHLWMIAKATTPYTNIVKWQTNYTNATNYKIYRNGSLIHTGTEGYYMDTNLTPNTNYKYEMYAVVGGVDTYVTFFKANTQKL